MHTEYFLIGGGNKTCLMWDCVSAERTTYSKKLLSNAEQVGFVSEETFPKLTMMGEELCINAVLALASRMNSPKGEICASGIQGKIQYEKNGNRTRITFEVPYTVEDGMVIFEGIGFLCTREVVTQEKSDFKMLAKKYSVPAFGIITHDENKIHPWVYVVQTESLIQETACGSGSIALHLLTGLNDIVQPSGEIISVTHEGNRVTVEAVVEKIL